jgi:hypothetical protein
MSNGFDESWYRDYCARMVATKPPPAASVVMPGYISFTLSKPTPLLNVLLRTSWPDRYQMAKSLSAEIASLVPDDPRRRPFERARVLIRRLSTGAPDPTAASGGTKILVDCLLVRSKTHPTGLGFVRDDDHDHMTLIVECERVGTQAAQCTVVRIERIR